MIECTYRGGKKMMLNLDRVETIAYNESQDTCYVALVGHEADIEVELNWDNLKKQLNDENI